MTAHQPCCTNIHAIFKVIFITVLLHFDTWFERLHVILTFHLLSSSSNVSWFSFCFSRRALFFSCSSSFASCMSLFLCCYLWLLTLHVSSVVLEIKTVCLWDFSPVVAFTLAFWCLRNGLCCRVLVIGFLVTTSWIWLYFSAYLLKLLFLFLEFSVFVLY